MSDKGQRVEPCKDHDARVVKLSGALVKVLRAHLEAMELEAQVQGWDIEARFGQCQSEICYFRHRPAKQTLGLGVAIGRLNIGFADGHVALLSNDDLVDKDGKSTFAAMWSPIDRELDQ